MHRDHSKIGPRPTADRRPLASRAIANTLAAPFRALSRVRPALGAHGLALLLALGLVGTTTSCDRASAAQKAAREKASGQIAELVEVYTPLDRTVTTDVKDAIYVRQLEVLDSCSKGGREAGLAALDALRAKRPPMVEVERALLTVAARAATDDALPLLESLVTQYGPALYLRTEAMLLLAEVRPARALELLEGVVTKKATTTMPPSEFILKAWVTACEKTGRSPVKELADVATNLFQEESARVLAVKELGRFKDPAAEAALRTILVESTGNGYLRRKAVQSLHAILPAETACELFRRVAEKEADLNFLVFLADALEEWCGR